MIEIHLSQPISIYSHPTFPDLVIRSYIHGIINHIPTNCASSPVAHLTSQTRMHKHHLLFPPLHLLPPLSSPHIISLPSLVLTQRTNITRITRRPPKSRPHTLLLASIPPLQYRQRINMRHRVSRPENTVWVNSDALAPDTVSRRWRCHLRTIWSCLARSVFRRVVRCLGGRIINIVCFCEDDRNGLGRDSIAVFIALHFDVAKVVVGALLTLAPIMRM